MDAIEITGLRYYGYVGYFPEEQALGQWFEVDLTLWLDLSGVGKSDRLEDTLNYADVVERVRQLIETSKFKMIERLNTAIIEAVLDMEMVQKVRSRVIKQPPIPGFGGHVAIDMTRSRDEVAEF
ncbi:dihydroneopterin aldolase [Lyngbya sp. CCY1209]|uniref:dihydroneopterin aldolase n=1 Tax=Lyngbya sp. CCY1209 TaxID=2886103 RepID=UPI002D1FCF47|nr:dihydroneopterin aldolase [Lyngbya sp. CCY1209]MEB3885997.1 dihydroneopterin aldolase [Lyngbya sp. CCY1209]